VVGYDANRVSGSAQDERSVPPLADEETVAYFDANVPEYGAERLKHAADFIRERANGDSSLIDIGCGVGNTLEFVAEATGIRNLAGIDVSTSCLTKTAERVPCELHHASILDRGFVDEIGARFDFALLVAVLHHLVDKTRQRSRRNAETAISHALQLLRPGGSLIIHEPSFEPRLAMDAVFYLKRYVSLMTKRRVPVFGYWSNIGPPVVSYYGVGELEDMVGRENGAVVGRWKEPHALDRPLHLVLRATDVTFAVERPSAGGAGASA
jgi:SAM-dependent methyltransferase